jgi:KDO2-lipid IV(A) lauroyltransferase
VVAALWLLGVLPRWLGKALLAPVGPLMYALMGSRRRIAQRNLQACFPHWTEVQRRQVLRGSFRSMARMLAEMAWCWSGPRQGRGIHAITDVHGAQHVSDALAQGHGVLLVSAHFSCLEMSGPSCLKDFPTHGVYRRLRNEVIEWYQNRGRSNYTHSMIDKNDLRGVLRVLRRGELVWYAPDQDFGPRESLFVPFFGITTATLQATQRLPAISGCKVIMLLTRYVHATGRYELDYSAPLQDFPGDDAYADLSRINAALEEQIRKSPEQYWWVHRRFKTRPPGEPPFYGAQSRRRPPRDS